MTSMLPFAKRLIRKTSTGLSSRRQPAGLLASFCPRTVIGTEYPEPVFRLETQTEKL